MAGALTLRKSDTELIGISEWSCVTMDERKIGPHQLILAQPHSGIPMSLGIPYHLEA